MLDNGGSIWDRWDLKGVPPVFVFGPDGKLAKRFTNDDPDDQFTYKDVTQFVERLLACAS